MALFSKLETETVSREKSIAADQTIYFLGDLHLGDGSSGDAFNKKDGKLMDFIKMVRMENAQLVLLGNAMDFAQAWSINRIIKAHARLLRELSEFAEEGYVTYVWGDYDTEISLYRDLLRFDTCSHLKIGDSILAQNGWQYASTARKRPNQGTGIKLIERILNTQFSLPLENHYSVENRIRFGWKYTRYKIQSLFSKTNRDHPLNTFIQQQICDPDNLFQGILGAMNELDCQTLITARSAMPGQIKISDALRYVNAGSWIHDAAQYAKWDGKSFSVAEFGTNKSYGEAAYLALRDKSQAHLDFEGWWKENHMGWLRFRCAENSPSTPSISPTQENNDEKSTEKKNEVTEGLEAKHEGIDSPPIETPRASEAQTAVQTPRTGKVLTPEKTDSPQPIATSNRRGLNKLRKSKRKRIGRGATRLRSKFPFEKKKSRQIRLKKRTTKKRSVRVKRKRQIARRNKKSLL